MVPPALNKANARTLDLLKGATLTPDEERKLVATADPTALPGLLEFLLLERHAERAERAQLQAALERHRTPPLHPATVVRRRGDRAEVALAGRRQVVTIGPGIDAAALGAGQGVLLNAELTAVVELDDATACSGDVAFVSELQDAGVIVRGHADEETLVQCERELLEKLEAGDRVVLLPGQPVAVRRLPRPQRSRFELAEPPQDTFDDVGGLDAVISQIRAYLDLHVLHPETAGRYKLAPGGGMLLHGPAGVGKTKIAKAIANHLMHAGKNVRVFVVAPGAFRAPYYGQTEMAIRELFSIARAHPGLSVILFEEVDSIAARRGGLGHEIDDRVLGSWLNELNGVEPNANILVIATTNRTDLLDWAAIREGRLGDHRYAIPRPNRAAARAIFARYLTPDLPYAAGPDGPERITEAALAHLFAPNSDSALLARATLANGETLELRARHVISGAMIASVVARAKGDAAHRSLGGGSGGLAPEDVLAALDDALEAEACRLATPHVARELDLPRAAEIVRVEPAKQRRLRRHRYQRFD